MRQVGNVFRHLIALQNRARLKTPQSPSGYDLKAAEWALQRGCFLSLLGQRIEVVAFFLEESFSN